MIEFLVRHDHLDFREALDVLSVRAGVELPNRGAPRKARGADDPLYEVLERACQYYKRTLHRPEGSQALAYLRGRGDGLLNVFVPHATAGLAIIETGAGSDHDLLDRLPIAIDLLQE